MTHSPRISEKIPKARSIGAAQEDGFSRNWATELVEKLDGCKSADRRFEAGCDLFTLGDRRDAIYRLVDGWVALYSLLEDGSRQILHFALPGAVLGFVPGRVMTYSAQALTDVAVSVVPYRNLYSLLSEHPEVGMQLAWLVARDRGLAFDRLSSIGRHSARERVAYLLLELFIRYRMRWPGHRIEEMHLPLTQEYIGDATGLTGVHVNRVIRDLRRDGILEFHYRRLRILDPDKLVDVAGIDSNGALPWIRDGVPNVAVVDYGTEDHNVRTVGPRSTHDISFRPPPGSGCICEGIRCGVS